jgi:hypothetical protein
VGLTYGAELAPAGVCQIPGSAIVASGQEAIRKLWIGLMDGEDGCASWAAKQGNGRQGVSAWAIKIKSSIERRASLMAAPTPIRKQLLFVEQLIAREPDRRKMSLLVVEESASSHFDVDIDGRLPFVGNVHVIPNTWDVRRLTRVGMGNRLFIVHSTEFKLCHRVLPSELD